MGGFFARERRMRFMDRWGDMDNENSFEGNKDLPRSTKL